MTPPNSDNAPRVARRRWSVGMVLVVALALALAVPLVNRAFGEDDRPNAYPGCGVAPWTGTCTCMLTPNGSAMGFEAFERAVRDPGVRPRMRDPEAVLATARRECRMPPASSPPATSPPATSPPATSPAVSLPR